MKQFVQTNVSGFVKDTSSQAIINTDDSEYTRFMTERERAKKLKTIECDLECVKSELQEIKSLLLHIVNGRQNG